MFSNLIRPLEHPVTGKQLLQETVSFAVWFIIILSLVCQTINLIYQLEEKRQHCVKLSQQERQRRPRRKNDSASKNAIAKVKCVS